MTIFSDVKDEIGVILNERLVEAGLAQEVRTSRGYDTVSTPYIIVSTDGFWERREDISHEVDLKISTVVKFVDATEEAEAEKALDDIEQVLLDLFGMDGEFQVHPGHWGAVDRYRRTWRPFSPLGPGFRYAEAFFRFIV